MENNNGSLLFPPSPPPPAQTPPPPPVNDHDLLIRLDTRFDTFEKNHIHLLTWFNESLHNFIAKLEGKVDKDDIKSLREKVESHDITLRNEAERKRTAIQIGSLGAKFWAGLMAFIVFLLTIYKTFH